MQNPRQELSLKNYENFDILYHANGRHIQITQNKSFRIGIY